MNLVFVHDHMFSITSTGELYSGGSYNELVWNRYFKYFNNIKIIARLREIEESEKDGLNKVPDRIKIVGISKYKEYNKNLKNIQECLNEADAVIVRLPSIIGIKTIKIAERMNKKVLVEVVGCPWDAYLNKGGIVSKIYALKAFWDNKRCIKKSKWVLYVTTNFLQSRYPNSFNNISCSDVAIEKQINLEMYEKKIKRIKHARNLNNYTLGLIGTLQTNYKGIDLAIKAIRELENKSININLEVVGQGDSTYFKSLARELGVIDKIKFLGTKNHNGIFEWLDEIDIYIQPSRTEGMPRATMEAMSRALPIVSSDVGGLKDLIDDKYRHKKNDAIDLANKIFHLINQREELENQCKINLSKSEDYCLTNLERKRDKFMYEFIQS